MSEIAAVTQLAETVHCRHRVAGSSPVGGSKHDVLICEVHKKPFPCPYCELLKEALDASSA